MQNLNAIESDLQVPQCYEIGLAAPISHSRCFDRGIAARSSKDSGSRRAAGTRRSRIQLAQLAARKSMAKAGAAFQFNEDFMPVKTAFW